MDQADENTARQQRIINVLMALALVFERLLKFPRPARRLVLWILRPTERMARDYVMDLACAHRARALPSAMFEPPCRNGHAEARRLAHCFREMAWAMENLTGLCAAPLASGNTLAGFVLRPRRLLSCRQMRKFANIAVAAQVWLLGDPIKIDSS